MQPRGLATREKDGEPSTRRAKGLIAALCAAALSATAAFSGSGWAQEAPAEPRPSPSVVAPQGVPPSRIADDARVAAQIAEFDRQARALEAVLSVRNLSQEGFETARRNVSAQRSAARALADLLRDRADPVARQLGALGPAPEQGASESAVVAARRAVLVDQLQQIEGRIKEAELAAARAETLERRLAERQRARRADQLLTRAPSVFSADTWSRAGVTAVDLAQRAWRGVRETAAATSLATPGLPMAAAFFGIFLLWLAAWRPIGRLMDEVLRGLEPPGDAPQPGVAEIFGLSLAAAALRIAPGVFLWATLLALAQNPALSPAGALLLERAARAAFGVFIAYAVARFLFAPSLKERRLVDLGDDGAWAKMRRAVILALLVSVMRIFLDPAATLQPDPAFASVLITAVALLSAPMFYALTIALLREPSAAAPGEEPPQAAARVPEAEPADAPENHQRGPDPDPDQEQDQEPDPGSGLRALLRALTLLVAVAVPVAAVAGFPELSRFLIEKALATVLLLAGGGLVYSAAVLALQPRDGREARTLTPVWVGAALAAALTPMVALIWGASVADFRLLWSMFVEGVEIDGSRYSLVDLALALGIFLAGLSVTRLAQRGLRRGVLKRTRLDAGAQTSISAGVGYTGVLISSILAVSAAGLDLSNLALVAGALSVGIGFGLQAIVNNFVSGLILLIERPVKTGDWIIVGGAEGYVRRINVRSTEIETFDRATVIVPNSDLISSQVVNLTHKSLTGRVIVKARVAFDTDTDLVLRLMRETARAHPSVLRHPQPMYLCMGVGEYGIDFELRAFIRDVNWIFNVRSDLTLALWKRLRDEGVVTPYPQRDLHVRSLPPGDPGEDAPPTAGFRVASQPGGV